MPTHLLDELQLDRPLIFFDLETTGLSLITDRIIQLAYIKYEPGKARPKKVNLVFNPEMPIPPSSTAVHGFTDSDVRSAPLFKTKAEELLTVFNNCYYSGFNIAGFDLLLLKQEFFRCNLTFSYRHSDILDTKTIYHYFEPRTLASAYKYYCHKNHVDAHDALADTQVTVDILKAQTKQYGVEKIKTLQNQSAYDFFDSEGKFYWKDEQLHFSFSKHRHRSLVEIAEQDPTFLEWILDKDFSEEIKMIIKDALKGKFPARN